MHTIFATFAGDKAQLLDLAREFDGNILVSLDGRIYLRSDNYTLLTDLESRRTGSSVELRTIPLPNGHLRLRVGEVHGQWAEVEPVVTQFLDWLRDAGLLVEVDGTALASTLVDIDQQKQQFIDGTVDLVQRLTSVDRAEPAQESYADMDWYQALSPEQRRRYDILLPYRDDWEAGDVSDRELADSEGVTVDTIRRWRRDLRRLGAPNMDWEKRQ